METQTAPTVEDQRDELIRTASNLRTNAVQLLSRVRNFHTSLRRKPLLDLEVQFDQLLRSFVSYDSETSHLLSVLASTRSVIDTTTGDKQPVKLNTQIRFAIITAALSSERETLRSLLQEIGNTLNNHRSHANTLTALTIATASLIAALISLFL